MKRAAILALLLIPLDAMAAREGIPIGYIDSRGRQPSGFAEARTTHPAADYSRSVMLEHGGSRDGRVVLIVDSAVSGGIAAPLATFVSDLEAEGWSVAVWTVTSPTAQALRADIQEDYSLGGLEGVILIGDIPAGWIEAGGGEYPADLYLMDMNGSWTDSDSDGLFDSWSGWAPEIWAGRLTPTWLSFGTSVELLENYFAKNHAFRTGALSLPDRALAYEEAFTGLTDYLDLVYSDVTRKSDPVGTSADDFRAELLNGYEWVHLISHSSPWGSSFHTGAPPGGAGTLNSYEAVPLDPHAFFYVLNCCTNGRWTEIDNLANTYIWADTYGLVAIAQAKTDYTNDFQELYQSLSGGAVIGDAFRTWLAGNLSLEHAAVLLGDPTLRPHGNAASASLPQRPALLPGLDGWAVDQITGGLHSEGDVGACLEPLTGSVFAAFGTSQTVRANILATRSTGDTWIAPAQICEHEYWDWHPAVGADGTGKVILAWHSMRDDIETYDIFASVWSGSAWSSAVALTQSPAFEVEASVAGGGGRAWVAWQEWDSGSTDIRGRFWTGSAWAAASGISTLPGQDRAPSLARGDDCFGIAYQAGRSGSLSVAFREAPDSGPFGAETIVSSGPGDCREPALAGDGSGFWAVWERNGDIEARMRDSAGSWHETCTLSFSGAASRPAVAMLDGCRPAVAWIEQGGQVWVSFREGSSWTAPGPVASPGAVESVAIAYRSSGVLAILYGARDELLHWDIWAASGDPAGVGGGGAPAPILSIRPLSNPAGIPAAFAVSAPPGAGVRILDITGRVVWNGPPSTGGEVLQWNPQDPPPAGVYVARVFLGDEAASARFVLAP